jgi:catechol 2,3-dioxygenase-like lactoylglutathione lyase family enzyme
LPVLTGIDHIIFAVRDPDAAAHALEAALGLRAGGDGRHEAHGTFNRLVWLGDSYIELMGVFDRELAERSWWGAHMLAVMTPGTDSEAATDSYAGIVFATDDVGADASRLRASGSPLGDPSDGQRVRTDGDVVRWRTARTPAPDPDLGLVFAIEHDSTAAEWRPQDRAARAAIETPGLGRVSLSRVEFAVPDVARASMRLLRDFGVQFRPSLAGGGARDASLGAQTLRLRRATGGASVVVALRATELKNERRVPVFGAEWLVSPA